MNSNPDGKTNRDVGDGEGVPDAIGRALVGFHLLGDVAQQLLDLAGHQSLALLQLLQFQRWKCAVEDKKEIGAVDVVGIGQGRAKQKMMFCHQHVREKETIV